MARSRRKTPISGITTAASDKTAENRKARSTLRATDLLNDDGPRAKAFGSLWRAPKDGKRWFQPQAHPNLLRK